jgi:hypothetical protein
MKDRSDSDDEGEDVSGHWMTLKKRETERTRSYSVKSMLRKTLCLKTDYIMTEF